MFYGVDTCLDRCLDAIRAMGMRSDADAPLMCLFSDYPQMILG